MSRTVKCGLIQCANALDTSESCEKISEAMIQKHLPFVDEAAKQGVKILCFQEVFNGPYYCPSQDVKWYGLAEEIPGGPTVARMQEIAKKHSMVLVVPMYERAMAGVYYNTAAVIDADGSYLGRYRKKHIPQVAGFWEKFFFKPGN
ncbi:MAG: nitrilase-related carbon-nitrogen hydrolase, partial [bacterium]